MIRRWVALSCLCSVTVWAAPVEDLSHGSVEVLQHSMDATRPLGEQVARLRKQVEGLRQLDLPGQIAALQEALSKLSGQVDEQAHRLAVLQKKEPATPAQKDSQVATDLYMKGLSAIKQEDFAAAQTAFKALIAQSPDDAMAIDASYWLAIAYFSQQKFILAHAAMKDFLASAKRDKSKEASAQLNMGLIEVELKHLDAAKGLFQQVIGDHPGSSEAKTAQEMLNKLAHS